MKRVLLPIILAGMSLTAAAEPDLRHFTADDGLHNNQVRQIVALPDGRIFVATEGAFSLYNGREFVEQPCCLDSVRPLPAVGGHSHLLQGDTLLWLKDFDALYLYDLRLKRFRYDYDRFLSGDPVRRFISENSDSLTHARVTALNPLRPLFDSLVAGSPLQREWLQASAVDHQGGLWLGMQSGGLLYVNPRTPLARLVRPVEGDLMRRCTPVDSRTLLLAGCNSICLFDTETQKVKQTLERGLINCTDICRDRSGRIWICTQKGLMCYLDGRLERYTTGDCEGFLHNHMRFAFPLSDERLLVCNLVHHLGYFYPRERRFELLEDLLPELKTFRTVVAACPTDDPSRLIVCSQNGLFLLDTDSNRISRLDSVEAFARYSRKYNCILRDRSGRTWIGTQNGLLLLRPDGGIRRITQADGLSNSCIQSLAEDAGGRLWVGTSRGVNRLSFSEGALRILSLGASDGIPSSEMEERGACAGTDGSVWMLSRDKLLEIPDSRNLSAPTPLPVRLVSMKVSGCDMPADSSTLHLAYNQNYLDLQLSDLNYAAPEQTRYRYRLAGIDSDWQTATGTQGLVSVRYNALPPGRYRFEAQAATGDNPWGTVFSKTFDISAPWWLTWWARLLYVLTAATLVIYSLHRYIRRRQKRLERDNDERVNRLFELRAEARHRFAQSVSIEPENIGINKDEELLVARLMKAIEQHMDDAEYTVDQLASDVGMSRSDLYRKTQQMLGITPNNFLRNVRLKHAAFLLSTTDTPVSRISLMVGFLTPRYFNQCFQNVFGLSPKDYRAGHGTSGN